MPLNTLRLNQRQLHPNERITFITALPGPTQPRAEEFLKRIAAICYPIMKAHSLSITTLEEFPPNREFMGRNFNGGEVIQLVLRRMPTKRASGVRASSGVATLHPGDSAYVSETDDGGWLSVRAVQMVMMHELAHCKQMNHSRAFWKVRDEYAVHLRVLWERDYTGEGMWGRGRGLESGKWEGGGSSSGAGEFEDLCGGTYRGRKRKRARLSYAERKARKLAKTEEKFGEGKNVGGSEGGRLLLEGKRVAGKPRVASSKRGRELRAAAALARFETAKVATEPEEDGSGTETESESETDGTLDEGKQVKDAKGNSLFRVRDDTDEGQRKHELDELLGLDSANDPKRKDGASTSSSTEGEGPKTKSSKRTVQPAALSIDLTTSAAPKQSSKMARAEPSEMECGICTLLNPPSSKTCEACGAVLADRSKGADGGVWSCGSKECDQVGYVNPSDAGMCGLCGQPKAVAQQR